MTEPSASGADAVAKLCQIAVRGHRPFACCSRSNSTAKREILLRVVAVAPNGRDLHPLGIRQVWDTRMLKVTTLFVTILMLAQPARAQQAASRAPLFIDRVAIVDVIGGRA